MRLQTVVTAMLVVSFVAWSEPVAADDGAVLVSDDRKVTLTRGENGEGSVNITLENQGAGRPTVKVQPQQGGAAQCSITSSPTTLEPHQQQAVSLTFAAPCDIDREEGIGFTVTVDEKQTFDLHANPPTTPNPSWPAVGISYAIAAALALLILIWAYLTWEVPAERKADGRKRGMSLPGLGASWKLSDSWAANATVLTALFAGVFGVENVVNALLGEDGSTNVLAVAIVSAAISVGLAGLSPMVLQMLRKWFHEQAPVLDDKKNAVTLRTPAGWYVTPKGLIIAALLTFTATGGQLGSILYAVIQTDFANDWLLGGIGALAAIVLIAYAFFSTQQNLTSGATLAKPPMMKAGEEMDEEGIATADLLRSAAKRGAPLVVDGQAIPHEDILVMLSHRAHYLKAEPTAVRPQDLPSAIP